MLMTFHRRMLSRCIFPFAGLMVVLLGGGDACLAFDSPVDRKGPLTVRIEGPEKISDVKTPLRISVHVENGGDQGVAGTVQLRGIDGWICRPAGAVAFRSDVDSKAVLEFQVTPGEPTYRDLYPIHAIVEFDWKSAHYTAHPILILEADVPSITKSAALPWQPLVLGRDRSLALLQMPVYRAVVHVSGRPPKTMPVGWSGTEQPSRTSVQPRIDDPVGESSRPALAVHPPWSGGQVGTACLEYPLAIPEETSVQLRFASAVTNSGDGDGVTFRVRVAEWDAADGTLGEIVFERHSAAKAWQEADVELSQWAGRTIRLQLESDPGPDNNTSFDQSYWRDPTLVIGKPPSPAAFPPDPSATALQNARQMRCGKYVIHVRMGKRGLLDADFGFHDGGKYQLWFRGFAIRVDGSDLGDAGSPITLVDTSTEPLAGGIRVRHQFAGMRGPFELVGDVGTEHEMLRVRWRLEQQPADQPWQATRIEAISTGPMSNTADRVYAGHGNVIEKPEAFDLSFDGHRLATSFVGFDFPGGLSLLQAVDLPPDMLRINPEQRLHSLQTAGHATFTFIPGDNVWELCKQYRQHNGLQASPGVKLLAGRFVFDLWGGRYRESGEQLRAAFRYGLTDSLVIFHNWQRWGYDYRLPEIFPPNSDKGTTEELRGLIDACGRQDVLFALHDNYIDFYPDADGFSYSDVVAFDPSGQPVKAWLNESREAQSYRYRADKITPFLQSNLQAIRKDLAPTSYFIDVWSSTQPYDYWTADGHHYDRVFTRDTWGKHFAWIRETLGNDAPQISESGHDQLIGWLDGATTNHLRVGKPIPDRGRYGWAVWDIRCADAERVPWMDAVHHDRFILHGAGYSSRYQAGLDGATHGIYSDDYMTTEILTGHPAMVSQAFGRDVVRKYWLTHDAMRALALRTIEDVEFARGDLHRQKVQWSAGGSVWVNRGETDWEVGPIRLPQYGFLAKIPTDLGTVTASIHRRDGLIVEQSQSPSALYVNVRGSLGQRKRIRPEVANFQSETPDRLEMTIDWNAAQPVPAGYRPFLHFVDAEGEIVFQASFDRKTASEGETPRLPMIAAAALPADCKPGDEFELRVGFYHPTSGGGRLLLLGDDDGEQRFRLGKLQVEGEGDRVASLKWTRHETPDGTQWERFNMDARPIDFGWVVTAGGCRLTRQNDAVLLTPLPEEYAGGSGWTLRWDRLPWKLPRPNQVTALDESGKEIWARAFDDSSVIPHDPAVFAYRLQR